MKTMEADMKEMESKKRILEEAVDSLNEEIAKLKAKGKVHQTSLASHVTYDDIPWVLFSMVTMITAGHVLTQKWFFLNS